MTCDWTRWTQKVHELPAKEDCARVWYRATFLGQMVEIEGELNRVFCGGDRLERIRTDPNYVGEPQSIQRLFEIIKSDPKNTALLREIGRAEKEVYAYLAGAPPGRNRTSTPMTRRMDIGSGASSRRPSCRRWCGSCYGKRRGCRS